MLRLLVVLCTLAFARDVLAQDTASQDREDTWKKCRSNDPDLRLPACTKLIDGGLETPADLASAYYSRGAAYRQKSLFALALEDYNAAIKTQPGAHRRVRRPRHHAHHPGSVCRCDSRFHARHRSLPEGRVRLLQPRGLLRADRSRRSRDRRHLGVDRHRAAGRVSIRASRHDLLPQESPGRGACRLRAGAGDQSAIRVSALRPRHHPQQTRGSCRRRGGYRSSHTPQTEYRRRNGPRGRQIGPASEGGGLAYIPAGGIA